MEKENTQTIANNRDPLAKWLLNRWAPVGIGGIAACMTIVFAFFVDWKLALGVLIAGISLSSSSWLIQFYRKQLLQREKQREKEFTAVRKASEKEFAAAKEAREATVVNRETTIVQLKAELQHVKGNNQAVIEGMHRLIESTRIEARNLYEKYKEFSKARGKRRKEILSEARELGNLFLLEALEGLINVFRPLISSTEDVPVKLWAAVRQHNPETGIYVTTLRHGEYTKVREFSSEGIREDRDIPKLIRKTYNSDGAGIVILSPSHESYDEKANDKFKDNLSMIAGPIIIGDEMPMFIVLNSPAHDIFHDGLKPYMGCCTSYLSECIRSWSELVEFVK